MPDDLKNFVADDDADVYADIVKALGFVLAAVAVGFGLLAVAAGFLALGAI